MQYILLACFVAFGSLSTASILEIQEDIATDCYNLEQYEKSIEICTFWINSNISKEMKIEFLTLRSLSYKEMNMLDEYKKDLLQIEQLKNLK